MSIKGLILGLLVASVTVVVDAQNDMGTLLRTIEENNTTLKALRDQTQADKLMNKTGITMADPEVEFAYMWGSPSGVPGRKDLSVVQNLDLSTLLGYKRRVADGQNGLIDWQYKQQRMNVLLETKSVLISLIYNNALKKELNIRLEHAQSLAKAYREKLKSGAANVLESNKIELNLSTAMGELNRVEVDRKSLLSQLQGLNGGIPVSFEPSAYDLEILPTSFDEWYAQAEQKSPLMQYVKGEIELNKEKVKLSKSQGLPSLSLGYKSEMITGQNYQGASVGLSIPLWSNRNRVKQAKSALVATESKMEDARLTFYSSLQMLYQKTLGLQQVATNYRGVLTRLNNTSLLKKALEAGQISLLDYIVEIGLYYNTVNQALQAERDYQLSLAELQAIEL